MMTRPVNAKVWAEAFDTAREANPQIAEATSPAIEIVTGGDATYYLTADDLSGYVVRDTGELVGLFSLVRGRGNALVTEAVADGADHLDCFDGYLPTLYARHGFREVKREANWTPGGPDVVYMRYTD